MPTLSNILLTDGAKSSNATNQAPKSSGKAKEPKGDEKSFASLMNLVSASSDFSQFTKTTIEKPGHAESPQHHKKTDDSSADANPLVGITPVLTIDPNAVLASPQNVFIPAPVSTAPVSGNQGKPAINGQLTAKIMPEIFTVGLKTKPAGQPAVVLPMVTESKTVPQSVVLPDLKDAVQTVPGKVAVNSPDSPDVANAMAASKIKTDDIGKPAPSEKTSSDKITVSDKTIIPPDAKRISTSPAPAQVAVLPTEMPVEAQPKLKPVDQSPVKQSASVAANSTSETATVSKDAVTAVAASKSSSELDSKITVSQMPPVPASKVKPEVESADTPPPDVDGTSIAKDDAAMKKTDKQNKFAGATEKILPGKAAVAREGALPARADLPIANGTADSSASSRNAADPSLSTNLIAGATGIDDRSRTLDRTQEMVVQHALRLNGASGDTLQVVIKPGAGTQLSLELRQHNGGVEVQATLQHGDFNHLNQSWPDLQQRLEQRGIRLAALADDGSFAAGQGGSSFQQKHSQPAEASGEFVPAFSASGTFVLPATVAATHRGWETWA
jgi:hypothetical protein